MHRSVVAISLFYQQPNKIIILKSRCTLFFIQISFFCYQHAAVSPGGVSFPGTPLERWKTPGSCCLHQIFCNSARPCGPDTPFWARFCAHQNTWRPNWRTQHAVHSVHKIKTVVHKKSDKSVTTAMKRGDYTGEKTSVSHLEVSAPSHLHCLIQNL